MPFYAIVNGIELHAERISLTTDREGRIHLYDVRRYKPAIGQLYMDVAPFSRTVERLHDLAVLPAQLSGYSKLPDPE